MTTAIGQEHWQLPIGSLSDEFSRPPAFSRSPNGDDVFVDHHVAVTISAITTWWPWCHEHHMVAVVP